MKINIPTSWEHVTIEQFTKLHRLKSVDQDPIEYMVNQISILCNMRYPDACKLNLPELREIQSHFKFIESPPKGKMITRYEYDKVLYIISNDISKVSAGQYIDLNGFVSAGAEENIHTIMASLAIPYKKEYNEISVLEIADKFWRYMPITVAYPIAVFFWTLLKNSMPVIQDYLENRSKLLLMETMQEMKRL